MSEKICCRIPPWFPARAGRRLPPRGEAGRAINLGLTLYRSGRLLPALKPINCSGLRSGDLLPWEGFFHQELLLVFLSSPLSLFYAWPCCFACVNALSPPFLFFPSIYRSVYCARLFVSLYCSLHTALPVSLYLSTAPGLSPGPRQWVTGGGEVGGLPGIKAPSAALPMWHVDPLPCSHSPGPTLQ